MKKIFTLAVAVLTCFSMWAGVNVFTDQKQVIADGDWTITGPNNTPSAQNSVVFPEPAAETGFPTGSVSGTSYVKMNGTGDLGAKLADTKCVTIAGLSKGDVITVYWFATNTTKSTLNLSYAHEAGKGTKLKDAGEVSPVSKNVYSSTFEALTEEDITNITSAYSGSAGLAYISCSNSVYVYAVKIVVGCKSPTEALAVSVQESDPIYVGDVVHFNVTGGNGGSPKLLLDGASYSDYAWGAEKGEHTFTVIQDKVGEYCAQEAEVKFTVLEKVPVASVVISGPDKGYVGHEITLTATAEGATEWRWMDSENSPIAGADKATYTFTPDHAGTWKFNCQARNEFNGETAGVKNWKSSEIKSIEVVVPETKIYSLNAGIGAAEKTADNATAGDQLVLSNSAGRIKLTPKSGETFKAGDKVNIGGTVGMANKEFGVIVYAANGSTKLAEVGVAVGEAPLWATIEATLNADAEYIFLARKGATTTTIYSCEISRDGVESSATAAGLAYDAASVSKAANDAAFINPLTNPNGLVVYYASSDVAVATVDPLSGEVTPKAEGSATISAHCGLQLKSDSYFAAGSASYALTVSAATGIENSEAVVKAVKMMENGQLIIIKNGVKYNAQGAIVK